MNLRPALAAPVALCLALAAGTTARAADSPFEGQLVRLAEILGSLHYLRNLCGETGQDWRGRMEALLEAENPDEARRARFVASFNRGYRSFETTYAACTDSAIAAIARYMKEGEALSRDTATRYGN
ncbi:MAG: TIGR02301 family protein [Hyphomicrobiales bacterium]|nr:MAG: TIGR02301 family protein [Hyphomicrobiales bacterium]